MRPHCREWHPTCSSGCQWVPALITWFILIRRRDGVWWWRTASQVFRLLFSLCGKGCCPAVSFSGFIKLKCISLQILSSNACVLLVDLLHSFLQEPGNLLRIPQVRADSCIEKAIMIFIFSRCAWRRTSGLWFGGRVPIYVAIWEAWKKLPCKHKYDECTNTNADIYIWEIETGAEVDESCDGRVTEVTPILRRVKWAKRRRCNVWFISYDCCSTGIFISQSDC